MAPGGKRLARRGKRQGRRSAIVRTSQTTQEHEVMDSVTRQFTVDQTRSSNGAIVDAKGSTGTWPLRRAVSYHVGVNCDSIAVRDGLLYVERRGRTIATAELQGVPSLFARRLRAVWEALLHPRHAAKDASVQSAPPVSWEQLLQPRDRKKR
jgi:hypothetical protein